MRLPEFEDCRDLEQLNGGDYFPQKELVCYASNHTNGIVIKNLKTNESVTVTEAAQVREVRPSLQMEIKFYLSHQRKVWDVRHLFMRLRARV